VKKIRSHQERKNLDKKKLGISETLKVNVNFYPKEFLIFYFFKQQCREHPTVATVAASYELLKNVTFDLLKFDLMIIPR
jgi:E3 ubiquitin-protein ligase DOA10